MSLFGKTWCFKKIMNYFNQNIQGHLSTTVDKLGIIVAKANLFQETKFCAIIFKLSKNDGVELCFLK